jgi:hypothetical protein
MNQEHPEQRTLRQITFPAYNPETKNSQRHRTPRNKDTKKQRTPRETKNTQRNKEQQETQRH